MERRFEGKVARLTGAATGIGQAAAVRLATEGALVAVNHRPEQDPAGTLGAIAETGGQGFGMAADMRDPAPVTSLDDVNLLFETNVRGTWMVCTEGAKQMIREGHGGAICCVSSISAHVGAPGQTAYCGTKGAISMLP